MEAYDTEHRFQAVHMVLSGRGPSAVAQQFGVTNHTIRAWVRAYRGGRLAALKRQRRSLLRRQRLCREQEKEVVRTLLESAPGRHGLPFSLWTMKAVLSLIHMKYGVHLSSWMLKRSFERWGFPSQKTVRRAFRHTPASVTSWLEERAPEPGSLPLAPSPCRTRVAGGEGERDAGVSRR